MSGGSGLPLAIPGSAKGDFSASPFVLPTALPTLSYTWERSDSVVECLTRDRRAVGSSLTDITALCP